MSHDEENMTDVIPVDQIRDTVMPPYEYQKPQNGFGSIGPDETAEANRRTNKSQVTTKE